MEPNPTLLTSFIHSDSIFYMIIIVIPYFRLGLEEMEEKVRMHSD